MHLDAYNLGDANYIIIVSTGISKQKSIVLFLVTDFYHIIYFVAEKIHYSGIVNSSNNGTTAIIRRK